MTAWERLSDLNPTVGIVTTVWQKRRSSFVSPVSSGPKSRAISFSCDRPTRISAIRRGETTGPRPDPCRAVVPTTQEKPASASSRVSQWRIPSTISFATWVAICRTASSSRSRFPTTIIFPIPMFIAQRAAEPTFPGNFGPFRTMVTLSRFAFTKCCPLLFCVLHPADSRPRLRECFL